MKSTGSGIANDQPVKPAKGSAPRDKQRFRDAGLVFGRAAWWAIALGVLVLFVLGTPAFYADVVSGDIPDSAQALSEAVDAAVTQGLFSSSSYAIILLLIGFLTILIFFAVGAIILHRRRDAAFPLFVAFFLLALGTALVADIIKSSWHQAWIGDIAEFLGNAGFASLMVFIFLFPNGRPVPKWTLYPLLIYLLISLPEVVGLSLRIDLPVLIVAAIPLLGLGSQIYRYRTKSTPDERQQTKWVLLALGLVLLLGVAALVAGPNVSSLTYIPQSISFWALPISIGFAVTRYRLWDVDTFISRALVYGSLTTILTAVFAASVAMLNQVSQQVLGQDAKAFAAVISAVLIAVLFQPLKDRLAARINAYFFAAQEKLATGLIEIEPGYWPFVDRDDLLKATVRHVSGAMTSTPVAVFLRDEDGAFYPQASEGTSPADLSKFVLTGEMANSFNAGRAVIIKDSPFVALVPLIVPRASRPEILGLIAVGTKSMGRGYSGYDLRAMVELGEGVAKALWALEMKSASDSS